MDDALLGDKVASSASATCCQQVTVRLYTSTMQTDQMT